MRPLRFQHEVAAGEGVAVDEEFDFVAAGVVGARSEILDTLGAGEGEGFGRGEGAGF